MAVPVAISVALVAVAVTTTLRIRRRRRETNRSYRRKPDMTCTHHLSPASE